MFVFGQSGCILVNWLFWGKYIVVFGQTWLCSGKCVCIRANWLYSGKSDCIKAISLYSIKVVVFGQSGCSRTKWINSGKVVLFG